MSKGALVVGSGPAGLQAALDLAEAGIRVHLVERSPFLCPEPFGDAQDRPVEGLRGDGAGMPRHLLRPRLLETSRHPHIQVLTNAEVARLTGERGDFRVEVQQHPRYVDPSACTACSECVAVCPVTIQRPSDPLNAEKAIYKPEDGVPSVFAIEKRGPAPCKAACPAGIHVQGYVALIAQGRFQEALALIREVIPFPSVCGRICHHPCESACRRGEHDEPIAIRDLKRFVADWETGQQGNEERGDESPHSSLLPKVAIVGSGPAGLTAAYFLAREGHPVTVFEALPVAGGMMAVGIPEHRLPKDVLRREIEAIEELGVEIRLNTPVGRDGGPGLDELRREYDALFIAVGAHKSRRLGVSGEDLEGVLHGVDFLHRVNLGEDVALGRRVIVVGGGDVAVDSAMVARRLGAQQVTILYRRSRAEMPAHPWEVEEAEEEGIAFHFLASPVRVLGEKGRVVGLECVRMELGEPDESGRRRPIPIPSSEFTVEADTVIVAIGQAVDASFLEAGGWELGRGGRIAVDPLTLATGVPGVFAGGDAVTGPATVIEAIAAGKRAAESIGRYLRGEDLATGRALEAPDISGIEYYTPPVVEPRARARMPKLPLVERRGFAEIHLGFDEAQAVSEAERCLSCSVCSECLECVQVCQPQAINHKAQPRSIALDVGAILWADGSGPERGGVQIAPDDVMGASAAAARVMLDLFRYRERPSVPPIPLLPSVPSGMAVFLCRCGGEISDVVDLAAMGEALRRLPDVALVEEVAFACHPDGAQAIERAIAERGLGRAVLAACSCCALDQICYSCSTQRLRCKGNLLRNPRGPAHPRFEFVNIREHCAFVHRDDPAAATAKATELVAAAVARARLAEPWPRGAMAVRTTALIVGRGPGAEASAEALTALGFRVVRAEADAIEGIRGGAGDFAVDERGGRPLRAGAIILTVRSDDERARLVSAFGAESLLQARDPLWAPVESWVPGIFLADSAVAGWAAAARAVGLLGRGWVQIQPIVARVDVARCRGCGDCVAVCPFGALRLVEEDPPRSPRWQGEEGLAVAQVSEALCQGCGACLAHCPTGAITAGSSSDRQVEAMLEAMLA